MASRRRSEHLDRLRGLADQPAEQAALAARLIETVHTPEVTRAALTILTERPDPAWHDPLVHAYDYLDANGNRRDPGGTLRTAIITALHPIVVTGDHPLLERAVTTYEFLYGEATGDLRAAGLLALAQLDHELAGYHAVRLLSDRHTSSMSGQPAVTAVRVLAAHGQRLPLYAYVTQTDDGPEPRLSGDVVAECLRHLTGLPDRLLPPLIERYRVSRDEIVLLGLFELMLGHRTHAAQLGLILEFLRSTDLIAIYRWLVTTLVAEADRPAVDALTTMAASERNPTKRAILEETLAVRQARPATERRRQEGRDR